MKRLISFILTVTIIASLAITAFAENKELNIAIYAKNGLTIKKEGVASGVTVEGGSAIVPNGEINLRDRSFLTEGETLYFGNEAQLKVVEGDKWAKNPLDYSKQIDFDYSYDTVVQPSFLKEILKTKESFEILNQDVVINDHSYIENVKISQRGNLVFDVPVGKTLYASIDNLEFANSTPTLGTVKIIGGGTVYLEVGKLSGQQNKYFNYPKEFIYWKDYVKKTENTLILSINNTEEILKNVFVEGDVYFQNSVNLDGNFKICGSVYSTQDINYLGIDRTQNENNTQEFNVLGQVYAPNGLVNVVGNARVRGQIIADRLNYIDTSAIKYEKSSFIPVTDHNLDNGQTEEPTQTPTPTPDGTATPEPTEEPKPEAGYVNGVYAEYYDLLNLNNKSSKRMARIESQIKNNWGEAHTPTTGTKNENAMELENFSAIYSGYIEVPESGNYVFSTYSDDGIKFTLDEKVLIDKWELISLDYSKTESIYLEQGKKYPYQLEYFQGPINAAIFLFWQKDDNMMAQIPKEAYFVDEAIYNSFIEPQFYNLPDLKGNGFKISYYDGAESVLGEVQPFKTEIVNSPIDMYFEDKEEFHDMSAKIEARIQAKYTEDLEIGVITDDGVQVYINDELVINEFKANSLEYYTTSIPVVAGEYYNVTIVYNNISGPGNITFRWKNSEEKVEIVPVEYLYAVD